MQIAGLLRSRPRPGDPDCVWADWFDAKANVFEQVAAESPHLAAEAGAFAFTARAMATDYRAAQPDDAGRVG